MLTHQFRFTPLTRGLLLLLAAGCGGSERAEPRESTPTFSLLARRPTAVELPEGILVPDPQDQWGLFGPEGWSQDTRQRQETPFVWASSETCLLILPAAEVADRTLALEVWCPPDPDGEEDEQVATVRLNGEVLGTPRIANRPERIELDAPARVWRAGNNFLELEVGELRAFEEGQRAFGVGLSSVRWDDVEAPRVDRDARELVLTAGASVRYRIAPLPGSRLRLAGEPTGPGRLALVFDEIDPATGGARARLDEWDVASTGSPIDRKVPVPETDALLEARLTWSSPEGSALAFTVLDFEEVEPLERFPVILLAIDTLSARHLSCYGYPRETSPNIDAFAAQATLFEHCTSNGTWTLPSFMSIMSGLYANCSNLDHLRKPGLEPQLWERWSLSDNRWTIAEALTSAGWASAAFVDSPWLAQRFGITQGFELVDDGAADYKTYPRGHPDGGLRYVSRAALEWLATVEGRPFFAFLHTFDVHGPYQAGERFDGHFSDDELAQQREVRFAGGVTNNYGTIPKYITETRFPDGDTPESLDAASVIASYDEGLAMTDDMVGTLFDELRARGLYDEALIVITSDHGETMAEKEFLFGHGVLEESCTHVPLIVKLPGQERGRRVSQTVQLVDLYPTLLELTGLGRRWPHLHGRSLVPLLEGEALPDAPTLTETGVMSQSAVVADGYKLVVQRPSVSVSDVVLLTYPDELREELHQHFPELAEGPLTEELLEELRGREGFRALLRELRRARSEPDVALYNVREDPLETNDLARKEPERVAAMMEMLEELIERREEGKALAVPPRSTVELSDEDIEELEGLGYTGE